MASMSSIQKAALSQALTVAKATMRGQGAAEAGFGQTKAVITASAATKKAKSTATLAKRRLKKVRIRV